MTRQPSTDLLLPFFLFRVLAMLLVAANVQAETSEGYLIGRGSADVTGPAYDIPMWGFGRPDQLTEGIHIRQLARAFIVAETTVETAAENPGATTDSKRLALVSVDIGSIEHNMVLEVVDRLKTQFGDTYHLDNLILSATHTHAGAGGYWHSRTDLGLDGGFYPDHFEYIVDGIVQAIEQAHDDLKAGRILINTGIVEAAGVNRSLNAYRQNPEDERARYAADTDKQMTLLRFENDTGGIGLFNWFAVHPTSMTYDNHLISGDHKGYASLMAEEGARAQGKDKFLAAFAQSNPGDVTANLNLDNTGPGRNDTESAGIIGSRQLDTAMQLYEQASEPLSGPIDYRRVYVDMSGYEVSNEFTDSGVQTTCPSAYGYAFAAGSTEDGGGHFLFREGMTNQNFLLDFLIRFLTGAPDYTQAVQQCQTPKPILFETGSGEPPLQSQIRSVTLARIGQLVILALPAEVTTMAGRRLRQTVSNELGDWAKHIVLAGYVNGYAGYITTPEEYMLQQYEAG
ncbi:MAG: hypothetical protein HN816_09265, partial [Gammaproteobacteria bacterium]|nr:hypothetical protein [Gammaproteobacteria bacterium]